MPGPPGEWPLPPDATRRILTLLNSTPDIARAERACKAFAAARAPLDVSVCGARAASRLRGLGVDRLARVRVTAGKQAHVAAVCLLLLDAPDLAGLSYTFRPPSDYAYDYNYGSWQAKQAEVEADSELPAAELLALTGLRELSLSRCSLPPLGPSDGGAGSSAAAAGGGGSAPPLPLLESLTLEELRKGGDVGFISSLTCLRHLRITHCGSINQLPDLTPLAGSLRELLLQTSGLTAVPEGLGSLSRLHTLELSLPGRRYDYSHPGAPQSTEPVCLTSLDGLVSLTSLRLSAEGPGALPEGAWGCTALRALDLRCGHNISSLPDGMFALLINLRTALLRCDSVLTLPQSLSCCTGLLELDASLKTASLYFGGYGYGQQPTASLPEHMGELRALQVLRLHGGGGPMPAGLCANLTALQHLELSTGRLQLPDVSGLASLESLVVKSNNTIVQLPGVSGLTRLTELYVHECLQLKGPVDTRGCTRLERLTLSECPHLAALPPGALVSAALNSVFIQDAGAAMDDLAPDSLGACAGVLTSLYMHGGLVSGARGQPYYGYGYYNQGVKTPTRLAQLPGPGPAGACSALLSLELAAFGSLTSIAPSLLGASCAALTSISIKGCPKLCSLPPGLGELPALKSLVLGDSGIAELPPLTGCGALSELCLTNLPLHQLPDSLGVGLASLRRLHIDACRQLEALPAGLAHATALGRLALLRCSRLTAIYGDWDNVPLRYVEVQGRVRLSFMPNALQHFINQPSARQLLQPLGPGEDATDGRYMSPTGRVIPPDQAILTRDAPRGESATARKEALQAQRSGAVVTAVLDQVECLTVPGPPTRRHEAAVAAAGGWQSRTHVLVKWQGCELDVRLFGGDWMVLEELQALPGGTDAWDKWALRSKPKYFKDMLAPAAEAAYAKARAEATKAAAATDAASKRARKRRAAAGDAGGEGEGDAAAAAAAAAGAADEAGSRKAAEGRTSAGGGTAAPAAAPAAGAAGRPRRGRGSSAAAAAQAAPPPQQAGAAGDDAAPAPRRRSRRT